eukprot:g3818.t1
MSNSGIEVNEDFDEWDPNETSFLTHVLAGSTAGLAEHILVFPIDTLKTHLQSGRSDGQKLKRMVKTQGLKRLMRGSSTMISACVPAHASYFSVYEYTKRKFGANNPNQHNPLAAGLAGSLATVSHDLVMTPFDVVKQRMQLGMGSGMISCFQSVIAKEGVRALYLSLPTTMIMNIPYGAVLVASHESIKRVLNPDGGQNAGAFLLSGALSGVLAAAVTNPLDVVKTKLQTMGMKDSSSSSSSSSGSRSRSTFRNNGKANLHTPGMNLSLARYKTSKSRKFCASSSSKKPLGPLSIVTVMRDILEQEGMRGFLRGIKPRLMVHAPAMGISWGTYETVKRFIGDWV